MPNILDPDFFIERLRWLEQCPKRNEPLTRSSIDLHKKIIRVILGEKIKENKYLTLDEQVELIAERRVEELVFEKGTPYYEIGHTVRKLKHSIRLELLDSIKENNK